MERTENTASRPAGPVSPSSLGALSDDLWFRHSRRIIAIAAGIVILAIGWFVWAQFRERQEEADNRRLGTVYVMLREDNLPAAERALDAFLATSPTGIARDKAHLYLGKVYYLQQRFDESIEAYSKVTKRSRSAALIHAGALHGRAAAHMQKGEYDRAATLLDELIKAYGARTGDPRENVEGSEVWDFAPSVPNALWKLALCRRELGQTVESRAAAERIVRAYPGSREAQDAQKLLGALASEAR
jgi:tetratricopeptide (TPR) repeat protein